MRPVALLRLLCPVVLLAVVAPACSDGEAVTATTPTTVAPTISSSEQPTSTSEPEPAYRTWIANVRAEVGSVVVHDAPGGPQLQLDTAGDGALRPVAVDNPLASGTPTTFRVKQRNVDANGTVWHEVYLPVRPNGSTGWITDAEVVLTHTDMSATIDLTKHVLELREGTAVLATYPVAAGEAGTPTPTGSFYVKELVQPPSPTGAYGPLAYGLSAFSPTLVDTEAFADGVIGIHGTNQPELLGTDVSHGCVRVRNDDVLDLERRQVPLGMPVTITA